jgi:hypothetical protein
VEFDFAIQHDLRKHSGTVRQGDIHIGGAPAHLTGTYAEQGESVMLNLKLAGPNMPDLKAVAKEKVKSVEGGLEKAGGGLIKGLLGGKKN